MLSPVGDWFDLFLPSRLPKVIQSKLGYIKHLVSSLGVYLLVLGSEQPQYVHRLTALRSEFENGIVSEDRSEVTRFL